MVISWLTIDEVKIIMKFEMNAGNYAGMLEHTTPAIGKSELIAKMQTWEHTAPDAYEIYAHVFADRVEIWQDLFLLTDRGADAVLKVIDGELIRMRIPHGCP